MQHWSGMVPDHEQPRVLIVSADVCGAEPRQYAGLEVYETTTVEAACNALSTVPVDAVLVDLDLPSERGVLFFQLLASMKPAVARIAAAKPNESELVAKLRHEGAIHSAVLRPFGDEQLCFTVHRAIRNAARGRARRRCMLLRASDSK